MTHSQCDQMVCSILAILQQWKCAQCHSKCHGKVGSKFCQILPTKSSKSFARDLFFWKTGAISPNLVTLPLTPVFKPEHGASQFAGPRWLCDSRYKFDSSTAASTRQCPRSKPM